MQVLFSHFRPFHPLQAPLLINGCGDPLSLFGHSHWCLIGSLYPFISILTYLMVTAFVFTFSPFSLPLQALFLPNRWMDPLSLFRHPYWYLFGSFYLFKLGILTYIPCCRFYLHIFALCRLPSSSMGGGIHYPSSDVIVVFNQLIISIQIHDSDLSYGYRIILPLLNYSSLTFWSLSLLVTVLYHHGF